MNRIYVPAFVLVMAGFLMTACSSPDTAPPPTTQNSMTVPGEKTGDSAVTPQAGPGGAGANVHF